MDLRHYVENQDKADVQKAVKAATDSRRFVNMAAHIKKAVNEAEDVRRSVNAVEGVRRFIKWSVRISALPSKEVKSKK